MCDSAVEMCPFCEAETSFNKFEPFKCKECGKVILPCSMCDDPKNNTCDFYENPDKRGCKHFVINSDDTFKVIEDALYTARLRSIIMTNNTKYDTLSIGVEHIGEEYEELKVDEYIFKTCKEALLSGLKIRVEFSVKDHIDPETGLRIVKKISLDLIPSFDKEI